MNVEKLEDRKDKIIEESTFEEIQELIFILNDFLKENGHSIKLKGG